MGIPEGITKQDVLEALRDLDAGNTPAHRRSSTTYDLVHSGRRYAPKAVISLAARRLNRGRPLIYGFSGGEQTNRVLRELDFEIILKDGATIRFTVGRRYAREDVQALLNVPEDQRHGNWDTGYSEWGGAYYLFCNVGQAGSTGHNYDNHFDGEFLVWRSKGGTHLQQPVIQELLDPTTTKHVFFREKLRLPFVYYGEAVPIGEPRQEKRVVQITWAPVGWQHAEREDNDEVLAGPARTDGRPRTVTMTKYERDPGLRQQCIDHWGTACAICSVDMARRYPGLGDGYIHVHHLNAVHEGVRIVDPIKDLRPVCPSCHSIIHRRRPHYDIEDVKRAYRSGVQHPHSS